MDLIDKDRILKERSHRAVAPIIATLILVAIAVVGGVMIFTFSQGFFGDQTVSQVPTTELVSMVGYDARDHDATTSLQYHDGNTAANTGVADPGTAGDKGDGDFVVIYVRNAGDEAVTITSVQTLGAGSNTQILAAAGQPATGNFVVYSDGAALATTSIAPGETGSVLFPTGADNASFGRTFEVKLITQQGSVFDFKIVSGQRS